MLGIIDAAANLAVKELSKARPFYEDVLGLKPISTEGEEVVIYKSGTTRLNVYQSREAGTNRATAVTWAVGSRLRDLVTALAAKGVTFEHYDMPGVTSTETCRWRGSRIRTATS